MFVPGNLSKVVSSLVTSLIADEDIANGIQTFLDWHKSEYGEDSPEYAKVVRMWNDLSISGIASLDDLDWWLHKLAVDVTLDIGGRRDRRYLAQYDPNMPSIKMGVTEWKTVPDSLIKL